MAAAVAGSPGGRADGRQRCAVGRGRTHARTHGRTDGRTHARTHARTHGHGQLAPAAAAAGAGRDKDSGSGREQRQGQGETETGSSNGIGSGRRAGRAGGRQRRAVGSGLPTNARTGGRTHARTHGRMDTGSSPCSGRQRQAQAETARRTAHGAHHAWRSLLPQSGQAWHPRLAAIPRSRLNGGSGRKARGVSRGRCCSAPAACCPPQHCLI